MDPAPDFLISPLVIAVQEDSFPLSHTYTHTTHTHALLALTLNPLHARPSLLVLCRLMETFWVTRAQPTIAREAEEGEDPLADAAAAAAAPSGGASPDQQPRPRCSGGDGANLGPAAGWSSWRRGGIGRGGAISHCFPPRSGAPYFPPGNPTASGDKGVVVVVLK